MPGRQMPMNSIKLAAASSVATDCRTEKDHERDPEGSASAQRYQQLQTEWLLPPAVTKPCWRSLAREPPSSPLPVLCKSPGGSSALGSDCMLHRPPRASPGTMNDGPLDAVSLDVNECTARCHNTTHPFAVALHRPQSTSTRNVAAGTNGGRNKEAKFPCQGNQIAT